MPKPIRKKQSTSTVYVGIDPGTNGGLACVNGQSIDAIPMPETERDVWNWLDGLYVGRAGVEIKCVVEEQRPRPTFLKGRNSILRSTCILFGNYHLIRGMLIAAGIPFEEVYPTEWLKVYSMRRAKKESDRAWKGRLRAKAQQLFPQFELWDTPRTLGKQLAVSDALLLAEYARRKL